MRIVNTYDEGGRVEQVVRDGETLNLFYNSDDLIVRVADASNNTVVEYNYDSNGRRVEMSDSTGEKNYLVAPNLGEGLDSPHLVSDAAGNPLASYVYAGEMPLMRLDANGNPTYYLEDGMGSVIGLADGTGSQVTGFEYDSFGNLRTPEGLPAELGGDFRFQGQWLESNTDFYHMRARYYDPETGRFISRDPVDLIETEPESSNPYQFVYNNPLIYSDPTGMFTLTEVNVSQTIQSTLRSVSQQYRGRVTQRAINEAQGVLTNVFSNAVTKILPFEASTSIFRADTQGTLFEQFMQNAICGIVGSVFSQFLDYVWLEVGVASDGTPQNNGRFRCSGSDIVQLDSRRGPSSKYSNPDFIIKRGAPASTAPFPFPPKGDPAFLIGDFKRSVTTIKTSGRRANQWRAIMRYARAVWQGGVPTPSGRALSPGQQYVPFALYVTLFDGPSAEARLQAKTMREYGVRVEVASFLPRR